jgi:hypothetical protein
MHEAGSWLHNEQIGVSCEDPFAVGLLAQDRQGQLGYWTLTRESAMWIEAVVDWVAVAAAAISLLRGRPGWCVVAVGIVVIATGWPPRRDKV